MPPLPIDDWTAALDRMDGTIREMRATLDTRWTEWAPVIETPATAAQPELLLAWLERRLSQWDARLTAAAELAAEVETELNAREASAGRWHAVFERWRNLIEQGEAPSDPSPSQSTG